MTSKQKEILKYFLVIGIFTNTIMSLNLYRQFINLQYSYSQLDSNTNNAIQTLSHNIWELKSSQSNSAYNYSGEFE